ncbi:MAG: hypothetical protein IT346_03135 [Epsilonproteobacteria bacterium]|nr:hypothetical protein [Campylobacterota bacterium]
MKLKNLSVFVAAICTLAPSMMHSVFNLNAIVRLERFVKEGRTVDLFHDKHNLCEPDQEKAIIQMLAQQKGSVCVEDITEHVGSMHIRQSMNPAIWSFAYPGYLAGLVGRLCAAGISASNVECRGGLTLNKFASEQEVADDYRNIRANVKVANPTDPVDKLSNALIERVEKTEDFCLNHYLYRLDPNTIPGAEVVDMIALKKLCKKDQYDYKALIAGGLHCEGVALALEKLGYKRTKCLEEEGKSCRIITKSYEPLLPAQNSKYRVLSSMMSYIPESYPKKSIPSKQIIDYFKKQDSYKAS